MTEVFIHIGTHKTGTTTIQRSLREASDAASVKNSWKYLVCPQAIRNFMHSHTYDIAAVDEFIQDLTAKIGRSDDLLKLIVSHEGLSGWPDDGYMNSKVIAKMLWDVTSRFGFDVKIIVYLRRQDEMVESMYTQKIHEGGTLCFSEFVSRLSPGLSYNYFRMLDDWASYFGKERLIVRSYHSASQRGLLEDFGEVAGINLDTHAKFERSNPSYSDNAIQIARIANEALDLSSKTKLRQALQKTMAKSKDNAHSLFLLEQRKEFLSAYEESNQNVADHFFGQNIENLFPKLSQDSSIPNGSTESICITPKDAAALAVELLALGKPRHVPSGFIDGVKVAVSGYPKLKNILQKFIRRS